MRPTPIQIAVAVAAAVATTIAAAAPAAAQHQPIAAPLDDDPVEPPVAPEPAIAADPGDVPDPPGDSTPDAAMIVAASAFAARMPDGAARWQDLGAGGALSIGWLQRRAQAPTGFLVRGMAIGDERARLYTFDAQVILSARLDHHRVVAPYLGLGLAFGTARYTDGDGDKRADSGLALGPAGGFGLHGFVTDDVYWRAELSAIGAGGAVVFAGLSLGWVFGT
jgi:hypothetical protein